MSALTKLFVVLLVICSFLLTAATVVFVNQNEDFRKLADIRQSAVDRLSREKIDAENAGKAAVARENTAVDSKNQTVAKKDSQIKDIEQKLADANNKVNELTATVAVNQATINQLATAQKAVQQTLADAQARNTALVTDNDKIRGLNYDLTGANTDFQKRLDEAERERRWLVEVNNQVKNDLTRAKNVLAEHRIAMDAEKAVTPIAPNLKGVIRTVKMVDGQFFATISIGSADHVIKGMEFNVVNAETAEFLGKLKVDTVSQTEAYGKLEGPLVKSVKADCQVWSQL